jgi:hypothetical protein
MLRAIDERRVVTISQGALSDMYDMIPDSISFFDTGDSLKSRAHKNTPSMFETWRMILSPKALDISNWLPFERKPEEKNLDPELDEAGVIERNASVSAYLLVYEEAKDALAKIEPLLLAEFSSEHVEYKLYEDPESGMEKLYVHIGASDRREARKRLWKFLDLNAEFMEGVRDLLGFTVR